jgi:hypothetical protein
MEGGEGRTTDALSDKGEAGRATYEVPGPQLESQGDQVLQSDTGQPVVTAGHLLTAVGHRRFMKA